VELVLTLLDMLEEALTVAEGDLGGAERLPDAETQRETLTLTVPQPEAEAVLVGLVLTLLLVDLL
jgi:hypothetical protein